MKLPSWGKSILLFLLAIQVCSISFANENIFQQARTLQRGGKYDEAIEVYKKILSQKIEETRLTDQQLIQYTDALVQLMNSREIITFIIRIE